MHPLANLATLPQSQADLLLPAAAATYLGLTVSTLAHWRTQRQGPSYVKYGGRVKYTKADLDAFISASVKKAETV